MLIIGFVVGIVVVALLIRWTERRDAASAVSEALAITRRQRPPQ